MSRIGLTSVAVSTEGLDVKSMAGGLPSASETAGLETIDFLRSAMSALPSVGHGTPPGPPIPSAFVLVYTFDPEPLVLLGKRCGAFAAGMWGWPGGKADRPGTMAYNCAAELREETGLRVFPRQLTLIEDACDEWIGENGQSYPSLFFSLLIDEVDQRAIRVMEPHKHSEWSMFRPSALPAPLFPAEHRVIKRTFGV